MLTFNNLDRQASSVNASAGKAGRSGRLGKLIKQGRAGGLGRPGVKETEHSWHELCGAERSEAPRSESSDGLLHPREGKSGKRWQRQTTERKLSFKMWAAVFRTNSSGALPVLANTGFRLCCKTNRKPYILAPTRVPGEKPKWHSDRQASSEC